MSLEIHLRDPNDQKVKERLDELPAGTLFYFTDEPKDDICVSTEDGYFRIHSLDHVGSQCDGECTVFRIPKSKEVVLKNGTKYP